MASITCIKPPSYCIKSCCSGSYMIFCEAQAGPFFLKYCQITRVWGGGGANIPLIASSPPFNMVCVY